MRPGFNSQTGAFIKAPPVYRTFVIWEIPTSRLCSENTSPLPEPGKLSSNATSSSPSILIRLRLRRFGHLEI